MRGLAGRCVRSSWPSCQTRDIHLSPNTRQTWESISINNTYIVSVLHQDEGGIGKSIPDARFPETREISRGRSPREISRVEGNLERFTEAVGFAPRGSRGAKPTAKENLEGGGDGFPNTSRVLVEHGHSLIITREGLLHCSNVALWW